MRRIAVACIKGGSSKTTTATALAVGLAKRDARVLLADLDQQANASWTLLGGQGADPPTVAEVLTRRADVLDAIRPTTTPGLELLPADASLGGVNVGLAQELGRDTRLRTALAGLDGRYDFVVLDTGPQFTTILANALVYAAEVIVPLDMGVYAALGLVQLQEIMAEVREAYGNRELRLSGLVLTKVGRSNVARDVEAELRARFGDRVFKAVVPASIKVEEAASRGMTVLDHAPHSPAARAYLELVSEVLSHGRAEGGDGVEVRGGPRAGDHAA